MSPRATVTLTAEPAFGLYLDLVGLCTGRLALVSRARDRGRPGRYGAGRLHGPSRARMACQSAAAIGIDITFANGDSVFYFRRTTAPTNWALCVRFLPHPAVPSSISGCKVKKTGGERDGPVSTQSGR
jgi:hypothetical protein